MFLLAVAAALAWAACAGTRAPRNATPPQFEPAESLLSIVAEFQRHRDADLYRFPYPRDVSDQNVFKATLVRLANYQTLNPGKFRDLVAFTRAQAYARLGEYETALRFCQEAQAAGGELGARAAEIRKTLEAFRNATRLPATIDSFAGFRRALETRSAQCRQLAGQLTREPWRSLAQCEWERAEVELAEFLWANRQVIPDGPTRAIEMLDALRKRHQQSKNFHRHTVRLGDWAAEMAAEYAALFPPERALFAWEDFERWTALAKSGYLEVAQSYGADERAEAAAKLAGVEAMEHRVRSLGQ